MMTFTQGLKGAYRLNQTSIVLAKTGWDWLLGDRPPLPVLLRKTFEKLGATYIKLGQFIASSPSLFPAEYVEEFQLCLDQTDPLPFSVMERILIDDLKKPVDSVFASIDPVPLASASIAQVYGAKLLTGENVVIKIQKPGVKDILLTDLNFLYATARTLETIFPQLTRTSMSGIINEIQTTMMEECDFYLEAKNLRKFDQFLSESGNDQVVVPKVYDHCSSRRVLTMERLYGVPLTDLESIQTYAKDPKMTLLTAMNTWFASLMMCDFFHADVHAGNLMVLQDGRVGFIDFGIVGRISKDTWEAVAAFMEAMMLSDYRKMAAAMVRIGITDQAVDIEQLGKDVAQIFEDLNSIATEHLMTGRIDDQEITGTLISIIDLGEQYGIRFPREFALLMKQFLYFDRYNRILVPEMNIFDDESLIMLPHKSIINF